MPQTMSISVNGESQVPPGFRFHPTEEELLHYYLRKKVSYEKIDLDVIRDVDLNKLEPWDIQEKCKIGTTPQNDWYFFSHKDKKYPTGTRTNRATAAGFWKATGRDKVIYSNGRRIGMRKTLVFYEGRAPHGLKSDWIMHEYRLDDNTTDIAVSNVMGEAAQEEGWVVCRVFKKKSHHKTLDSPLTSSALETKTRMLDSCNEGALDQILQYMQGKACKEELNESRPIGNNSIKNYDKLMKLPSIESPDSVTSQYYCYQPWITDNEGSNSMTNQVSNNDQTSMYGCDRSSLTNWVALDRLVASQLNGQTHEACRQLAYFNDPTVAYSDDNNHHPDLQFPTSRSSTFSVPPNRVYNGTHHHHHQDCSNEIELWNFTGRPSTDPLCHMSNSSV